MCGRDYELYSNVCTVWILAYLNFSYPNAKRDCSIRVFQFSSFTFSFSFEFPLFPILWYRTKDISVHSIKVNKFSIRVIEQNSIIKLEL